MRTLLLPAALFPFSLHTVAGRPWWSAMRTPDKVIHYMRTDGERYEGLAGGTMESSMAALARRDAHKPLPVPPPCEGQVWYWRQPSDDGTAIFHARRMILSTLFNEVEGRYDIAGIIWSEAGVTPGEWPPSGADLVDGPFAPWSPSGGVTLAELTEGAA